MTEFRGSLPEGMVSEQIAGCYVRGEQQLLIMSNVLPPALLNQNASSVEETRERSAQTIFQLGKTTADKIQSVKKSGFEAARDFWMQQLGGHTLTSAQETFGNSRLGQINQRLEEFNKPPETPL